MSAPLLRASLSAQGRGTRHRPRALRLASSGPDSDPFITRSSLFLLPRYGLLSTCPPQQPNSKPQRDREREREREREDLELAVEEVDVVGSLLENRSSIGLFRWRRMSSERKFDGGVEG